MVHKLGCKGPQTTKELLNIPTRHASGEEAVGAIFDRLKGKAKQDEDASKDASNHPIKKKNKQRRGVKSPRRAPQTTLRSYSRGHDRTMPSPSSIYTRIVAS